MANIFDYIEWRGDLDIKSSPLNEVDFLILAWLSYATFDDYVPYEFGKDSVKLCDAGREYLLTHDVYEILKTSSSFTKTSSLTWKTLSESKRFGNIRLTGFEKETDLARETQFAAITYITDEGAAVVAYRGTDDTLIGWKEDFNMAFTGEIPAQRKAVEYLEKAAKAVKGDIYLCGHSKGGNLAIYSALKTSAKIRNRIKGIYNFDGPGFSEYTDLGKAKDEVFKKTYTFVPEQSLIGMLLNHDENYIVVASDGKLIMQHDATTWQVLGNSFIRLEGLKASSRAIDETIKNWVAELSDGEREKFVNELFKVLMSTSLKTIVDINDDVLGYAMEMIKNINDMPKETKKFLRGIVSGFIRQGSETLKRQNAEKHAENKHIAKKKVSKDLIDTSR